MRHLLRPGCRRQNGGGAGWLHDAMRRAAAAWVQAPTRHRHAALLPEPIRASSRDLP
jgi:hypothetical protein